MNKILSGFCITVLFILQGCPSKPKLSQQYKSTEHLLKDVVKLGIPGVSVCHGAVENYQCSQAGVTDVESQSTTREDSKFRTASITKTFTAALIFKLRDLNFVDLDKPISHYIKSELVAKIPNIDNVKVIDLLEHTSGIFNFTNSDKFEQYIFRDNDLNSRNIKPEELVSYAADVNNKPSFSPGMGREYSNTGYILLGLLVESVTGLNYQAALKKYIFGPSGMTHSILESELTPAVNLNSYAYVSGWDNLIESQVGVGNGILEGRDSVNDEDLYNVSKGRKYYNGWAWSAGAISSNAGDLAKFLEKYLVGDYQTILNPGKILVNKTYGWRGTSTGIDALMMYDVKQKNIYVVLINATNGAINANDIYLKLRQLRNHSSN